MTEPLTKPAPGSGKLERFKRRLARRRQADANVKSAKLQAVREDRERRFRVYLRDHRKCRAFGVPLKFETDYLPELAHNHHIIHLSAGGTDDDSNTLTLSGKAHQLHHAGLLDITGNANDRVRFTLWEYKGGTKRLVRAWEN